MAEDGLICLAQLPCYKVVTQDPKTWFQARGMCKDMGGDLATLETLVEIYWIRGYRSFHRALRTGLLSIGGYRQNGHWIWKGNLADTPIGVTDWAVGEPNDTPHENCIVIIGQEADKSPFNFWFRWLNVGCDSKFGYICEKSMSSNV